jgi:hypothetical protein
MKHVSTVADNVQLLLSGSTDPDPEQHGMTTEEERAASRTPQVAVWLAGLACGWPAGWPAEWLA